MTMRRYGGRTASQWVANHLRLKNPPECEYGHLHCSCSAAPGGPCLNWLRPLADKPDIDDQEDGRARRECPACRLVVDFKQGKSMHWRALRHPCEHGWSCVAASTHAREAWAVGGKVHRLYCSECAEARVTEYVHRLTADEVVEALENLDMSKQLRAFYDGKENVGELRYVLIEHLCAS